MDSTTVDLKSASLSDEQASHVSPLVYAELRAEHRQIIDEASGDGKYEACPPIPDAAESVVDLAEQRIDRQWDEFGGNPENRPDYLRSAYLEREGEQFELQIVVEDMVVS